MPPVKRNSADLSLRSSVERDFQALVQEGQFAQALRQNVVAVFVTVKMEGSG